MQVCWFINLQTAKLLGLDVPPMLLARADEVIEYCKRLVMCNVQVFGRRE